MYCGGVGVGLRFGEIRVDLVRTCSNILTVINTRADDERNELNELISFCLDDR